MISLTLATALSLLLVSANDDSYEAAHQKTMETGRPMVVLVGATWCPACREMEKDVIPEVRQRAVFKRVAFAHVDLDQERELGKDLTAGGAIPQLIVFRHNKEGWTNERLIGGHSVEQVEKFIKKEVAAAETDKTKDKDTSSAAPKQPAKTSALPSSATSFSDEAESQ